MSPSRGGFAVIDCGTNSTRLLIVDGNGTELCRELRITRLGEGVGSSSRLADAAIERNLGALSEYRRLIDHHEATLVRVFATSAARDATNRSVFFDRAEEVIGVRPELLTGEEEGELTYVGATMGLPASDYLVLDIGGGSTEFVLGTAGGVTARSVDIGCVRLTEDVLQGDPYAPEELANAFAIAEDWCTEVSSSLAIEVTTPQLIGVAGTVTSLAAMDLGLSEYTPRQTHHHRLSRDAVEELFRTMSSQTEAERRQDPLLPPGRSDVMTAGTVILLSVLRHFAFDYCLVSEKDILDGAAMDLRLSDK